MMQRLEGTSLGHYHILQRLGVGGMSSVYLARDEQTQDEVAIKVVNVHVFDHAERFRREITALTRLTHAHILPIYDWGEESDWIYLVMPYTRMGSLSERLEHGSLSLEEAGLFLSQIASALQFAHDHGYVHRDLKPANILLRDEGFAYLADFGLAKAENEGRTLTQTGFLMGTPEYMAPELSTGPATPACDIYALGILLYQMLTGQTPYTGSTPFSIYMKHINDQPLLPSSLNPAIPASIEEIIICALEKEPENRFSTAQEMADVYQLALENIDAFTQQATGATAIAVTAIPRLEGNQAIQRAANAITLLHKPEIRVQPTSRPQFQKFLLTCAAIVVFMLLPLGVVLGMNAMPKTDGASTPALYAAQISDSVRKTPTRTPTPVVTPKPTVHKNLAGPVTNPLPDKHGKGHGKTHDLSTGNASDDGNGKDHSQEQ